MTYFISFSSGKKMRSFIALFALAAITTVADGAAVAAEKTGAAEASVAAADPAAAEAAVATPEDRAVGDCPDGFIPLAECGVTPTATCVRVGSPLKYVSWLHLQYQCDSVSGYLPEITATTEAPLALLLQSYEQLYGPTTLYLGATDITDDESWKWLSSGTDLVDDADKWTMVPIADDAANNKDCLSQFSTDLLWSNVNCEADSAETQIANICFAKAEA